MKPKEKALELYLKYYNRIEHTLSDEYWPRESHITKICALIAVDELYRIAPWSLENDIKEDSKQYWQEVKQEIYKL